MRIVSAEKGKRNIQACFLFDSSFEKQITSFVRKKKGVRNDKNLNKRYLHTSLDLFCINYKFSEEIFFFSKKKKMDFGCFLMLQGRL